MAVHKPFISRLNGLAYRSNASSYPFIKIHHPFERLELSVRKNSSAVRTAQAIRSKKIVSRSNGLSYPFEKIHQPFERLELFVRNKSSAVQMVRAIRSRNPRNSQLMKTSFPGYSLYFYELEISQSFPGSLFSASLGCWKKEPGCGWSHDHPESGWQKNLLGGRGGRVFCLVDVTNFVGVKSSPTSR